MKIYSWNVNGIRSVATKGALDTFLAAEDPDIICFQETKAHESQLDIDQKGYHTFWASADKKGYSGTAIWSKTEPLTVTYGLPEDLINQYTLNVDAYGDVSSEGRVITAEYDDYFVTSVYTPNTKNDLSRLEMRATQWDPAFRAYVARQAEIKPVIFAGDLNVAHTEIDLANPKANKGKHGFTDEERTGFDQLLAVGFTDTYRSAHPDEIGAYTWWTHWANARARNVGWRIDYVMASSGVADRIKHARIHQNIMGSDHCPVSIEL